MTDFSKTALNSDRQVENILEDGVRAARAGQKKLARELLFKATELDPAQVKAWLWLSEVTENSEEALIYLKTVIAINAGAFDIDEGPQWMKQLGSVAAAVQPGDDVAGSAFSGGEVQLEVESLELAPSFILSVEQAEAIDVYLKRIAYDSEARYIILADVTGQLIAERGRANSLNTQVLSALAAGELAATHEMARLVGEPARFKLLLHEGQSQSVYLSDVGEQLILIVIFDNDTPIGLVRMVLKQAVKELAPILIQSAESTSATSTNEALGDGFARLLENELDSLEL